MARVEYLEQKLQEAFNLLGAIVIDAEKAGRQLTGTATHNEPTPGDIIHAKLGDAMAELIATGAVFRDSDCIGLGSGRGGIALSTR